MTPVAFEPHCCEDCIHVRFLGAIVGPRSCASPDATAGLTSTQLEQHLSSPDHDCPFFEYDAIPY